MTHALVLGKRLVVAGASSVAAHPAAKSQHPRRAIGPSRIAMNGINQIRYCGEKTFEVTTKARMAAPVYRTPSVIPRRWKTRQTVRMATNWVGKTSAERCCDQGVIDDQAAWSRAMTISAPTSFAASIWAPEYRLPYSKPRPS